MVVSLHILIVEDSPDDAELLMQELRRSGFEPKWKRVETEPDFLQKPCTPRKLALAVRSALDRRDTTPS